MAVRSKFVRAGAAVLGASSLMMLSALPASADQARGRLTDDGDTGYNVDMGEGKLGDLQTSLMRLALEDGKNLHVYCVEIDVNTDRGQDMVEHEWNKYPNPKSPFHNAENRSKVNWVLHHGFPVYTAETLGKGLEKQGVDLNNGLSEEEAITATQAAVWHFSDDKELKKVHRADKGSEDDILAMYKVLTGELNTGIADQPAPALDVTPKEASGEAGTKIGPFEVASTAEMVEISSTVPEGVKIVDENGNELAKPTGETEEGKKARTLAKAAEQSSMKFFVDVPKEQDAGKVEIELKASTEVATGRLFVGEKYEQKPAQSLIVAKSDKTDLKANVTANWTAGTVPTTTPTTTTPAPTTTSDVVVPTPSKTETPKPVANEDDLASTGASVLTPILIGVGLLAAGGAAIYLQRRRHSA